MDSPLDELRALYQERQWGAAREFYERSPGCADPEWYFIGSLVYWHLQEYPLSRWTAEYGLTLRPRGEIRMKLLYRLGTTEETLGGYGEAIEHLEECLAELPAYDSLAAIMTGAVAYNLALAYYNRNGQPESLLQAVSCYERAAGEFRREGMRDHLRSCLQNLAWALCDLGQASQAGGVLDEAAPLCTTEPALDHQRVVNAYQLLVAGDRTRALTMVEPLARREDGSSSFVFALCVTALAALGMRDLDPAALESADAVIHEAFVRAADPTVDPRCWTTAKRIRQQVMEAIHEQNRGA